MAKRKAKKKARKAKTGMRECPSCHYPIPVLPSGKLMPHAVPYTAGRISCPGESGGKQIRVTNPGDVGLTLYVPLLGANPDEPFRFAPDPVLGYRAWDRGGGEHLASTPDAAGKAAYYAKARGKKRKPVLVMARKQGGVDMQGVPQEYSVPVGYWAPKGKRNPVNPDVDIRALERLAATGDPQAAQRLAAARRRTRTYAFDVGDRVQDITTGRYGTVHWAGPVDWVSVGWDAGGPDEQVPVNILKRINANPSDQYPYGPTRDELEAMAHKMAEWERARFFGAVSVSAGLERDEREDPDQFDTTIKAVAIEKFIKDPRAFPRWDGSLKREDGDLLVQRTKQLMWEGLEQPAQSLLLYRWQREGLTQHPRATWEPLLVEAHKQLWHAEQALKQQYSVEGKKAYAKARKAFLSALKPKATRATLKRLSAALFDLSAEVHVDPNLADYDELAYQFEALAKQPLPRGKKRPKKNPHRHHQLHSAAFGRYVHGGTESGLPAQFTASKRRYKTEAAAWKAVSKQYGLGQWDACPAHLPKTWRWIPVQGGLAGARARQENPLRMAVIGNPAELVPVAQFTGRKSKEWKAAVKAYEKFHGCKPTHVRRVLLPDGKKKTKQQVMAELGRVPETHYHVDASTSTKHGYHWHHSHIAGNEPLMALDPQTGTWTVVPMDPRTEVGDWFRN